ncbi:hypothetical protein JKP88DRAFT_320787 [Tribonema minus]|uniref:Uncharacterized protein n=1 Tax=Tribonema minus TaxID=303371 RepID=A0A836CE21_9STRA|nr:hypothetical protein JKP88DRAFT_320787 [Tribonema minus]
MRPFLPLLLVVLAKLAQGASSNNAQRQLLQLLQEPSLQQYPGHALSLQPAAAFAAAHIDAMHQRPPDQLFRNSLVHSGGLTDLQLEVFFRKCANPGSVINVGAIGGSNTQLPWSFLWPVVDLLQEMCPHTTVTGFNGARGSHGSLTLGMCIKTVTAPQLDIAFAEFALNDQGQYRRQNGRTSSFPYELMTRTMLANYDPAPAVFNLFMWGRSFTFDSAQADLEPVVEHYDVTALSLRDLVWPFVTAQAEPWPNVARLTHDNNHANEAVQHYVGQLFVLYICERFQVLDMETASTLLPVHSDLGIVLFSNCYRTGYLDTTPAFRINLVEGDAEPYKRTPLQLVSAMQGDLDGNAEMYRVDPPLEPGERVLEAVPNPECTRKLNGRCDGFYSVITL